MSSIEKLAQLRASMKESGIDVYIIPNSDPHLGEYIPDYWRIVEWLTGFTGSNATLVITGSFAGLWTDSRYYIQAENQLEGSGFSLILPAKSKSENYADWLVDNISEDEKIGLDGRIFSISSFRELKKRLVNKKVTVVTECDLINDLWTVRPALPIDMAFDFPVAYCGKERSVKIREVREVMRLTGIDYHLLTACDDIMWLLNIRGNDVKYSPLLSSFALVGEEQILLFAEETKIPFRLALEFDKLGIVILPYEETEGMLSALDENSSLLISPSSTSTSLYKAIPSGVKIIEDRSIPSYFKAIKNKTEIENIGKAMVKDGVALSKFFFWLEENYGILKMSELALGEKLTSLRAEQDHYFSNSFSPIVAWNGNGALPHYSATPESDTKIRGNGLLLLDSGGQYFEGTTDITRTIAVGKPTAAMIHDFSLVLKGHIALATASFPVGTKGIQLDILARKSLWDSGMNYGHGTGHGVGFFLNVHEGPQSISLSAMDQKTAIEPGMLISNEPAVYREGEYGIRIENLVIATEDKETEFGKFLKFDTVTLCYIDKNLIDKKLLDKKEIEWIDMYHSGVFEKLGTFLAEPEKAWLKDKTNPI